MACKKNNQDEVRRLNLNIVFCYVGMFIYWICASFSLFLASAASWLMWEFKIDGELGASYYGFGWAASALFTSVILAYIGYQVGFEIPDKYFKKLKELKK